MNTVRYTLTDIPEFKNIIKNDDTSISNILKVNKLETRVTNNSSYTVIRYDKNFLSFDLIKTYGLCRSVIVNSNNKVVGFAPPKSIPCDTFINNYLETEEGVVAEEFVEGTMVNLFWDETIGLTGDWEISTRNIVGATSTFYKSSTSKSFRTMFLEATKASRLSLNNLDTDKCYSFVMQHPDNRIVVPFKEAKLYLVAVYSIHNEENNIWVHAHDAQEYRDFFKALSTTVQFPEVYTLTKYSDLISRYASMNTPYSIVGVVLHNKITGERAKIRNPVYEQVRALKGNHPKLQYQYLSLRKEGKVGEYLKFYPENKREFSAFRDNVHLFTNTLFANYVSCYIKKVKPLNEFPEQYKTHMFNLHQKYLTDLREKKQFVTNTVVIQYVNDMVPSLLMYCLNFHMRKRNIDTIVADNEE